MRPLLLVVLTVCTVNVFCQKKCVAEDYENREIQLFPDLSEKFRAIQNFITEKHRQQQLISSAAGTTSAGISVIKIPVVVHILYNSPAERISEAQVRSQIEVLNKDFRRLNADTLKTPPVYKNLAGDCQIEFSFASKDPHGKSTSGIVWKKTSILFFGIDDRIKYSAIGGDDAWDPKKYLNIWVGSLAGMMGYSSTPGGPENKDGIVVSYNSFGTTGSATIPFNKGRTTVHEIGHWLGLRHTWGDAYCGDDHVDDTPAQERASRDCPSGIIISCNNGPYGNMYMNFMDLTNDDCTNMFTKGQVDRMRSMFSGGGPRYPLLQSDTEGIPSGTGEESGNIPAEQQVIVYPNPASDHLTIQVSANDHSIRTIAIYNQVGQMILKQRIVQSVTHVNILHLNSGVYYIRIEARKGMVKFIKY